VERIPWGTAMHRPQRSLTNTPGVRSCNQTCQSEATDSMSAQKKSPIPAERVALYEKLLATLPGIERKGADNPYMSLNGNMFSLLLSPEGRMALRLPQDEREHFLEKYKTTLFEAYGAVMQEYVAVPDALLQKTKQLQGYLALSYPYAKTLKPQTNQEEALILISRLGMIPYVCSRASPSVTFTSILRLPRKTVTVTVSPALCLFIMFTRSCWSPTSSPSMATMRSPPRITGTFPM